MSLGPSGANYLRDWMEKLKIKTPAESTKIEIQPAILTSSTKMMSFTADQMQKFLRVNPLEYLFSLNVAGMQARNSVRNGTPALRKTHDNHFTATLDDREFADQLFAQAERCR